MDGEVVLKTLLSPAVTYKYGIDVIDAAGNVLLTPPVAAVSVSMTRRRLCRGR